ncbi:MAG: DUF2330 domain-containing protein [Microbacteriaceae bacterium]
MLPRALLALPTVLLAALGPAATASAAVVPATSAGTVLRAIVTFDGSTETIDLALTVPAGEGRIGLVFPTPSRAEVTATDADAFAALDATIAPQSIVEDDWWGREQPETATEPTEPSATGEASQSSIRGSDSGSLRSWLKQNDLELSDDTDDTIDDYVGAGWALALVAFDAPATTSELAVARLSFTTDEAVFPLALFSDASSPLTMRFYVAADGRTVLHEDTTAGRDINAAQSVVWAGTLAGTEVADLGDYLTVTDVYVTAPEDQLSDDLRFDAAAADDEVIPAETVYRRIELLGLPAGWLLTAWGAIGLVLGVSWLGYRARRR